MRPDGQRLDFVLEFLHRFRPHRRAIVREEEAEKLEALLERSDLRLFGGEFQLELFFNDALDEIVCLFTLRCRSGEDKEVIGIPDKDIPSFGQFLVEHIQDDVCQQGRDDSTLRRAHRSFLEHAIFHDTGLEKLSDGSQDVAIGDLLRHQVDNQLMLNIVEEALNIGIENDAISLLPELQHFPDGLVTAPIRPESEREIREVRFKIWLDQFSDHFLCHSVAHGWDAQRPEFTWRFWYQLPPERLGLIRAGFEVFHEPGQVLFELPLEHRYRNLIDAGRAAIFLDGFENLLHQVVCDSTGQRVSFTRFHRQCLL